MATKLPTARADEATAPPIDNASRVGVWLKGLQFRGHRCFGPINHFLFCKKISIIRRSALGLPCPPVAHTESGRRISLKSGRVAYFMPFLNP